MERKEITELMLLIPEGESATFDIPNVKIRDYIRNKCYTLNQQHGSRKYSFGDRGNYGIVTHNKTEDQEFVLSKIRALKSGESIIFPKEMHKSLRGYYSKFDKEDGISVNLVVEVKKK